MVRNTLYWVNILLTIQYRALYIAIIQYIYLHTVVILRTFYIGQYRIVYIVVNTGSHTPTRWYRALQCNLQCPRCVVNAFSSGRRDPTMKSIPAFSGPLLSFHQ